MKKTKQKKKLLAIFYLHTLDYPPGTWQDSRHWGGIATLSPLLPIPSGSRDPEKARSCDSKSADMQSGKPHIHWGRKLRGTGCSDHKDNREFGRDPFMLQIMSVAWEKQAGSEEFSFLPEPKMIKDLCEPPKTTVSTHSMQGSWYTAKLN